MISGTPPKPIAPVGRLPFAFAKRHGVLVRGVADGRAQVVYREGAQPSAVAELRRSVCRASESIAGMMGRRGANHQAPASLRLTCARLIQRGAARRSARG